MDNSTEKRDNFLECPLGGDETNDCADCIYSVDYHFVDGKCVKRHKQDDLQNKCPICKYTIDHCQCLFGGNAHPNRNKEREVVLDHLYLLSEAQLRHVIKLEKHWRMSYIDFERTAILEDLKRDYSNNN